MFLIIELTLIQSIVISCSGLGILIYLPFVKWRQEDEKEEESKQNTNDEESKSKSS